MKRFAAFLLFMCLVVILSACGGSPASVDVTPDPGPEAPSQIPDTKEEESMNIQIIVGDKSFYATLADNASAKALVDMLPMTLNMSELNGNEKYYYLDNRLPTDAGVPDGISAGDIKLFGNHCLVLFYESFSTSYSYTPLGQIDDPEGLAEALGNGAVSVTFEKT